MGGWGGGLVDLPQHLKKATRKSFKFAHCVRITQVRKGYFKKAALCDVTKSCRHPFKVRSDDPNQGSSPPCGEARCSVGKYMKKKKSLPLARGRTQEANNANSYPPLLIVMSLHFLASTFLLRRLSSPCPLRDLPRPPCSSSTSTFRGLCCLSN